MKTSITARIAIRIITITAPSPNLPENMSLLLIPFYLIFGYTYFFIRINLRIIFRRYLNALIEALCIKQNYRNIPMKQSVLAITTVILLLGGVVTVALIQNAEATGINTTRSNIKHAAKEKGG